MEDSLYEVEYAKSDRSLCKACRKNILKDEVRIAILLQSAVCDKKVPYWHHECCFLKKKPNSNVSEIHNFENLLNDDQERIKAKIKMYNAAAPVLPKTSKIRKRSLEDTDTDNLSLFSIEYAKSSAATCRYCDIKIPKSVIRISKSHYDPKRGDISLWYHVQCFIKKRDELLFFANGACIPGFENLELKDQITIKNKIQDVEEEVISKRLKQNINSEINTDEELGMKTKTVIKLCSEWKTKLEKLKKDELQLLLQENNQDVSGNKIQCINRLANYFNSISDADNVGPASSTSQDLKMNQIKIPDSLQYLPIFNDFKNIKTPLLGINYETNNSYPLKNLQFYLHGKLKTPKDKLQSRILGLGGLVVKKLTSTIAAVVTTKKELTKVSSFVQKLKSTKIEVVEESFFDMISTQNGTVIDSINYIIQFNIADWKSDPFKRIPQSVIDGKSVPKLGSMYQNIQSVNVSKLYVRDGIQVDSRSGLESLAHIYREDEKAYSATLTLANVDVNKNSYYKLELWESNKENKYWIFQAWGRIGTKIGKTKLTSYSSIDAAKKMFLKIYADKTKQRRRSKRLKDYQGDCEYSEGYIPIDLNYDDFKRTSLKIDNDSKLPQSVQLLVISIFDTEIMKNTLLQFELDVEKMPLGKLSICQIKAGYEVLSELMQEFKKNAADPTKVRKSSNKFYSLIPHSVGVDNLPLLDSVEIVKQKEEMLNSLSEIEIAYKLLHLPSDEAVIPIERHYLKLKTDICPVDKNEPDFILLSSYIKNSHAPTHSKYKLEITEIFRVVREGEEERYKKFKQLHNKRLLWHGSRMTNLAGILSQGLRIAPPEAPQTGKMFGNGVYFADMVSKSANYCHAEKTDCTGFLFVCEVALGEMIECYKARKITKLPDGKDSVWGVGQMQPDPQQNKLLDDGVIIPLGIPVETKARSKLQYNEFIVYDIAQVNVKYLVQLKFNFK